ncbi:MAG: hypothetical protein GF411_09240 [Candidatus Lokiarchaeota archaeon]|nr:hypothetical protein [Candidatus Lokiarchaeota archaeon]
MDFNEEFQLIQELADEDVNLAYDEILHSECPWVGLYTLSLEEYSLVVDQSRLYEIVNKRESDILGSIRSTSSAQEILGCLESYPSFLERNNVLNVIARVIRKSKSPFQIIATIKHVQTAMNHSLLRSAIIESLQKSPEPWNVISTIRDFPQIYNDVAVVEFIVDHLQNHNSYWVMINEINDLRTLAEHPEIIDAIRGRIDDIAEEIRIAKHIRDLGRAVIHNPELNNDLRIIKAISEYIIYGADAKTLIYEIRTNQNITSKEYIQKAIGKRVRQLPTDELSNIIEYIGENRILLESPSITRAIADRLDDLTRFILDTEKPHTIAENISLVHPVIEDPRIRAAFAERIDDIVSGLNEVTPWWSSWYLFERSIWVPEIFNSQGIRELLADYIILEDEVGNLPNKIRAHPYVLQDPVIWEAVIEAIHKFSNPIWIITSVCDNKIVEHNRGIRAAIEERIPDIILLIEDEESPYYLTQEVSDSSYLLSIEAINSSIMEKIQSKPIAWILLAGLPDTFLENKDVNKIISENIDELCGVLYSVRGYLSVQLSGILRYPAVKSSKKIQKVLAGYRDRYLYELKNSWDVWYAIYHLRDYLEIVADAELDQVVLSRSKDIAYAVKNRDDGWSILGLVSCIPELLDNHHVFEAMIDRIRTSVDPWNIFSLDNIDYLLEREEIRNSLDSRIEDFVFGITSTIDAQYIIESIEDTWLSKDTQIQTVINRYQRNF